MTGDIVVHTWDLAKAAGVDATIDHEMAVRMVPAMIGDRRHARGQRPLQAGGAVPDDASVEDKLVAATGRDPDWTR